jgi:Mg-chelatase subunit ChlD
MRRHTGDAAPSASLADLSVCDATADTGTGRVLVGAPMFAETPKPAAVQVIEGGQPGEVLSVEAVPARLHVVVLFDSSFSMRRIFPQAQEAALRFVEKLPPDCTVDFFDFDTQIRELPAADRTGLVAAIRKIEADGSTRLYDSILRGLAKCAAHRRSVIVVFTDGFDAQVEDPANGSRASQTEIFAAVTKARVPLYTIAYGEKPDAETLKRLAATSGGTYFRAQPDTIASVFEEIGRLVARDYRITYRRPAKVTASNTPVLTFVLDVSGSMDMDPAEEGCGYRIETAKDLLRDFFGRKPAGIIVQLFTFSNSVNLVQVPTADPERLLRALTPIEAGGGTETLAALEAARASIEKIPSRSRYLLFITDAALQIEEDQRRQFEIALAALKAQGIHSLWVGMVDAKDQAPFENAATLSGGAFVVSPSTDSLANALAALEKTLREQAAHGSPASVEVLMEETAADGAKRLHGGSGLFPLPISGATTEESVSGLTVSVTRGATP